MSPADQVGPTVKSALLEKVVKMLEEKVRQSDHNRVGQN